MKKLLILFLLISATAYAGSFGTHFKGGKIDNANTTTTTILQQTFTSDPDCTGANCMGCIYPGTGDGACDSYIVDGGGNLDIIGAIAWFTFDTALDTAKQWGLVEIVSGGYTNQTNIIFRDSSNGTSNAYGLQMSGDNTSITSVAFLSRNGTWGSALFTWTNTIEDTHWFGFTVQETGDNTLIDVYEFASDPGNDPTAWSTATHAQYDPNPGANANDTGTYVGVVSRTGPTATVTFDNLRFGTW